MAALDYHAPNLDRADFDAARLEILRRRIAMLAYSVGTILILLSALSFLITRGAGPRVQVVRQATPGFAGIAMMTAATIKQRRGDNLKVSLRKLIARTSILVVVPLLALLPASPAVARALAELIRQATGAGHVQIGSLMPVVAAMLCIHLVASCIVPWSLWESARPVLVILLIAGVAALWAPEPLPARIGGWFIIGFMGVPGMLVCWFRFSQLRQRVEFGFIRRRYGEVQNELAYARRIHEKLFPQPIRTGAVRFDFRYEPMRQIGGDFVDAIFDDGGALTIVLVDVTGHGIAAALAVNRLHGEIKRTLATSASASPAEIIAALNEYVHLTLADESVFATALALRVDPRQHRAAWCSAGHPPAFLWRAASRQIQSLDSTAMLLGPLPSESFEPGQSTLELRDCDVLFAYTDGAIEARDASEKELGIEGLRQVVASASDRPPGDALDAIMSHIAAFRSGPAEDDTLVLTVSLAPALSHAGPGTPTPQVAPSISASEER